MRDALSRFGLTHWLDAHVSARSLLAAFALAVVCQGVMAPLASKLQALSGGLGKLSLTFSYDAATLREHMLRYGAEGRHIFAVLNLIDLIFPPALAAFCLQAGWLSWRGVSNLTAGGLAALAIGFCVFDWLEKAGFFILLLLFPEMPSMLSGALPRLTEIKLVVLVFCYCGLLTAPLGLWARRRAELRRAIGKAGQP